MSPMATRRLIYVSATLAGVGLGLTHVAAFMHDMRLAVFGGAVFFAGFVASWFLLGRGRE
jgi:hypothetical protein